MMSIENNSEFYQQTTCNNNTSDKDQSDYNVTTKEPIEWLIIQNNELKEKLKKIEFELDQWKSCANDNKEKLNRIHLNKDKHNYVDAFYDTAMHKLIQSLGEENVKLKRQNEFSGANKIYELYNAINSLRQQLDIKSEENRLLKDEIKKLNCIDCSVNCKDRFLEFERVYSATKVENTNLRNQIHNQIDVTCYMKSQFSKQRNEFISIFTEHYLKNGDQFIDQLKTLDPELPEFLKKPLHCDISTSIENLYTSDGTVEISAGPVKEFKESPESINQRLRKTVKEKNEVILSLERCVSVTEENLVKKEKQLEDANNEWRVVYGQVFSKLEKHQKQYEQLQTYSNHLEERNDELKKQQTSKLRQRSASVSHDLISCAKQSSIYPASSILARGLSVPNAVPMLCRDSPSTLSESSLQSRGLSSSTDVCEQTKNDESAQQETNPNCKNCKRTISPEKYKMHITYCGKSGSHIC